MRDAFAKHTEYAPSCRWDANFNVTKFEVRKEPADDIMFFKGTDHLKCTDF